MEKKRLFLDMDGTIARFHDNILDEGGHVQIELMYESGFFRKLEPFQNMIDGMKLFMEKHPEVEVFSLSAAQLGDPPGFVRQKDEWLDEFLPEIDRNHRIYPECGVPKSGYIPDGVSIVDYLIDDFNKNLNEWVRDGGKSIKCKNNINHKGTGKFGGDVGNLWTGDMVSNLDSPEKICIEIETFMGLSRERNENERVMEPEEEFDEKKKEALYEKWFDAVAMKLPEGMLGSFQEEKQSLLKRIQRKVSWVAGDPLGIEKMGVCKDRIDEFVYNFALHYQESREKAETLVPTWKIIWMAMNSTYQAYVNEVDFVTEQIHVQVEDGYYTKEQETYLLEHIAEVANHFGFLCHQWFDSKHAEDFDGNLPLDEELSYADRAIAMVAGKEKLMITANTIKDNYPPVEIDISRRDLEKVLKEVYKDNPVSVEEFLDEYIWDNGDQVKNFLESHKDFCKDGYQVRDFAESKYSVTITDWGEKEDGNELKHMVATFYPEKIDQEFEKMLFEKGYEGYHILVSEIDAPFFGTLFNGVLDAGVAEAFQTLEKDSVEKENDSSLDGKIREATGKCSVGGAKQSREMELS